MRMVSERLMSRAPGALIMVGPTVASALDVQGNLSDAIPFSNSKKHISITTYTGNNLKRDQRYLSGNTSSFTMQDHMFEFILWDKCSILNSHYIGKISFLLYKYWCIFRN